MDSTLLMPESLEFFFVKENSLCLVVWRAISHRELHSYKKKTKKQKNAKRKDPHPFPWGETRQGKDGELQQRDAKQKLSELGALIYLPYGKEENSQLQRDFFPSPKGKIYKRVSRI